jgi:hypothetical protein
MVPFTLVGRQSCLVRRNPPIATGVSVEGRRAGATQCSGNDWAHHAAAGLEGRGHATGLVPALPCRRPPAECRSLLGIVSLFFGSPCWHLPFFPLLQCSSFLTNLPHTDPTTSASKPTASFIFQTIFYRTYTTYASCVFSGFFFSHTLLFSSFYFLFPFGIRIYVGSSECRYPYSYSVSPYPLFFFVSSLPTDIDFRADESPQ